MSDPEADRLLSEAQDELARTFEGIAEFWGFTRTQGRIFGLLFLSPEPMDHGSIRARLQISAGSTSMTLAALQDWGVVHRDGRMYWAETDLWKLITAVFRRREREKVDDAIARVRHALDLLARAPAGDPRVAFARERLSYLLDFFTLGRALLNAVVGQSAVRGILTSLARHAAKLKRIPLLDPHKVLRHVGIRS
ncbi:MAG: hypothetical protein H6713_26420 [Myxococcales bacterium]|nr:hypothetical protein [Myxococcales bacterium]MCB9753493.1 hypothetical protein [Myxococcales bacterium]